MRLLLGITGQMGSGKTTLAQYLVERYNFTLMQISGKMREIAYELEIYPDRDFLQGIGKFMREFDDDVWVRYLAKKVLNVTTSIVVDDIRRKNEIDYLSPLGFKFIRIESLPEKRRGRIELRRNKKIDEEDWIRWSKHLTEIQVAELPVDYLVTNDNSIENLLTQIDDIIIDLEQTEKKK